MELTEGEYTPHNESTRRGISRNKKVYTPAPQDDDDKETPKGITRGLIPTKYIYVCRSILYRGAVASICYLWHESGVRASTDALLPQAKLGRAVRQRLPPSLGEIGLIEQTLSRNKTIHTII